MDADIQFDLSDLSGDSTPCSLDEFLTVNAECPPSDEELAALRSCPVGGTVYLGIGGGAVLVRRVA